MRGFRYVAIGVAAALAGMIEISAYPLPYPYFYVNPLRAVEKVMPNYLRWDLAWKRYENTGHLSSPLGKITISCDANTPNDAIQKWVLSHCKESNLKSFDIVSLPADLIRSPSNPDIEVRRTKRLPQLERELNEHLTNDQDTSQAEIHKYMNASGLVLVNSRVFAGHNELLTEYFGLGPKATRTSFWYTSISKLPLPSNERLDIIIILISNDTGSPSRVIAFADYPSPYRLSPHLEKLDEADLTRVPGKTYTTNFPMYLYVE